LLSSSSIEADTGRTRVMIAAKKKRTIGKIWRGYHVRGGRDQGYHFRGADGVMMLAKDS